MFARFRRQGGATGVVSVAQTESDSAHATGSIRITRRAAAAAATAAAAHHPFACRGDSLRASAVAAATPHSSRDRPEGRTAGAPRESRESVVAVRVQVDPCTWTPLDTGTCGGGQGEGADPEFTMSTDAFRNRRRVLDKRVRKRSHSDRPSGAALRSRGSSSSQHEGSDLGAGTAATTDTPPSSSLVVPNTLAAAGGGGTGTGGSGHDAGFVEVKRRRKRTTSAVTRSRLAESIYRVKREWSVRRGDRTVEDEAKALTEIMFNKYAAVGADSTDETPGATGNRGADEAETELHRMVRMQNALFEQQLASTVATADRARATVAKINANLAAKVDRRRVERKVSVRVRAREPASLCSRIARATAARGGAAAPTAGAGEEDRDDNMGFGDLCGLPSSDEEDGGGDGRAGGTQHPPLAPAGAGRQLPHRPAPWSKRWKPHALESWRQKRTARAGCAHGASTARGDELPLRRHRRVSS